MESKKRKRHPSEDEDDDNAVVEERNPAKFSRTEDGRITAWSQNPALIGNDSPGTIARNAPEGLKQLTSLRAAIFHKAIFRTQGSNWKSQRVSSSNLISFLNAKIKEQRNRLPSVNTFDYLERHIVGIIPSAVELKEITSHLASQFGGECRVSENYLQTKIPSSDNAVSSSDKKNAKLIGVIQVQAYLIVDLLRRSGNEFRKLEKEMSGLIESYQTLNTDPQNKMVAAHLCKKKCISDGHVLLTNHSMNRKHDYCPGWWIVNKTPVCFCVCDENRRCLAPGILFNSIMFGQALTRAVGGLFDPGLSLL
jgi:hypothetical protein